VLEYRKLATGGGLGKIGRGGCPAFVGVDDRLERACSASTATHPAGRCLLARWRVQAMRGAAVCQGGGLAMRRCSGGDDRWQVSGRPMPIGAGEQRDRSSGRSLGQASSPGSREAASARRESAGAPPPRGEQRSALLVGVRISSWGPPCECGVVSVFARVARCSSVAYPG